jgi:hypothetical protein
MTTSPDASPCAIESALPIFGPNVFVHVRPPFWEIARDEVSPSQAMIRASVVVPCQTSSIGFGGAMLSTSERESPPFNEW